MRGNKKIFSEGFTLSEMLVNMIIVSAITISMFFVFFEIKYKTELDYFRDEIRDYSNLILDEVANEFRRTRSLKYNTILSRTKIQTTDAHIIVDLNDGVKIDDLNDDENGYVTISSYLPIDSKDGLKKFSLNDFTIDDVSPMLGDNLLGEAQDARNASRDLKLEIFLYTKYNQTTPYDTLRFERRVFCPGLLIVEKNENS